jgi:predicted nucleic acid-binding protein
MKYLADVNVVLPILLSRHVHRDAALNWFNGAAASEVALCTHVRLAVLRLLCNRKVMGEDVQTPDDAWRAMRTFEMDERVAFLREP